MNEPGATPGSGSTPPLAPPSSLRTDGVLERLRAATIGEYDVHSELARGGMASVYLAHDLALDRKVAIKVMSPGLVFGEGMTERFKREARTAAALSHPNIIPVYTVREVDGLCFFVMKLIQGTTLDAVLAQEGSVPIAMVEAVLAQAGSALGYAHRNGVIHRDVKPGNIMIDDEGWVVVTDFGIAKVADAEGLTLTGMAVGTPAYMSPEQCLGGTVGPASDQYSLGVIAYEMLAGKRPFGGGTSLAMMFAHANTAPPPLEPLRPDCPEALRAVVIRMLEKEPAARYRSMEEALKAIGGPASGLDESTRSRLVELARTGTIANLVARAQTPRSPVPITRAPARAGAPTMPTPAPSAPPAVRTRPWLVPALGGLAAGALAVAFYLALRPPAVAPASSGAASDTAATAAPVAASIAAPSSTTAPPNRPVASDPGPPARRSASEATRVEASPAPSPPPPPVAVTPPTENLAIAKVAAEGATVPRLATPAPPPTPIATRAAEAPAAVDPRPGIEAAIDRYRQALESGDLTRVRRAYPGLTVGQHDGLEAFFSSGGRLHATWTVGSVTVTGDTATALITGVNQVTAPRSKPASEAVNLRIRLERRGDDWRLLHVDN
jgi:Protein kinase domain